ITRSEARLAARRTVGRRPLVRAAAGAARLVVFAAARALLGVRPPRAPLRLVASAIGGHRLAPLQQLPVATEQTGDVCVHRVRLADAAAQRAPQARAGGGLLDRPRQAGGVADAEMDPVDPVAHLL